MSLSLTTIAATLAVVTVSTLAGVTEVPMCTYVKGFASELHNEFSIRVGTAPRPGEAIVLVVRPIPYVPGIGFISARINATYKIMGADVSAISDGTGILQITDTVEDQTLIDVQVVNRRTDGSTPFVFYSYHAGYRSCSLPIAPSSSFTGPLPTHVINSDNIAPLYLSAIPPPHAVGFTLVWMGLVTVSQNQNQALPTDGTAVENGKAVILETPSKPVFLTVRPSSEATETKMVHMTVEWLVQKDPIVSPSSKPSPPPAPVGEGASPSSSPAPVDSPFASGTGAKKAITESVSFVSLLMVGLLAYFMVRTVYNYRVKKITEFPQFVPHHEFFSTLTACCGAFASHVQNRGRSAYMTRAGGYSDVNRDEM